MWPRHTRPASATARPCTTRSTARGSMRSTTSGSRFVLPQNESHTAHGVKESWHAVAVDLSTKACHLHVDDIVERRRAPRLLPHIPRQHFAGDEMALMPDEILEQIELAAGELDRTVPAKDGTRDDIDLQIAGLQPQDLGRPTATQERSDASE